MLIVSFVLMTCHFFFCVFAFCALQICSNFQIVWTVVIYWMRESKHLECECECRLLKHVSSFICLIFYYKWIKMQQNTAFTKYEWEGKKIYESNYTNREMARRRKVADKREQYRICYIFGEQPTALLVSVWCGDHLYRRWLAFVCVCAYITFSEMMDSIL